MTRNSRVAPIKIRLYDYRTTEPVKGPEDYRGIIVPERIKDDWAHPYAVWWRQGVNDSKSRRYSTDEIKYRSYRDRRKKACVGKYPWDDPYYALREMFALPYRSPGLDDTDISLYRCEFCDYWHLGGMKTAWWEIEESLVAPQIPGQEMIPFPELEDYSPDGHVNTRRDGLPYE